MVGEARFFFIVYKFNHIRYKKIIRAIRCNLEQGELKQLNLYFLLF